MNTHTTVNVLLIEDDVADAQLVKEFLTRQKTNNYKLDYVTSFSEAIKVISSSQIINYDVILVDYFLGQKNGLDLVKEIANRKLGLPIIFLTGNNNMAVDLEAMRLGAADFIVKGKFDGELLDRSIRYSIEHKKNQRLLIKQQQKEASLMKASALADMASFVVHEINNPLSVIQMQASSIELRLNKKDIDIEKTRTQIQKILSMISRILEIKKNLQKYYKNQTTETKEVFEDLNKIVLDSLQLSREYLASGNIKVIFEPSLSPIFISCQAIELSQVFINLINNSCEAIKDLKDRWLKIEVQVDNEKAKVVFTDSGSGIPEAVVSQLFSKYFTTKSQGSGIGLHLSRHIIESYGGELNLNSLSPNTQFIIDIPLKSKSMAFKKYRFLVVDDEADFANMICENISQRGFLAEKETDPIKAKEKILNGECDVVITDLQMIELNGLDLALSVVAETDTPPVFTFMSGYVPPATKALIKEKNLGLVFEKPFNVEDMVVSTIDAIQNHRD